MIAVLSTDPFPGVLIYRLAGFGDTANDIAQEVRLRVLRWPPQVMNVIWYERAVASAIADHLRRRADVSLGDDERADGWADPTADAAIAVEQTAWLRRSKAERMRRREWKR